MRVSSIDVIPVRVPYRIRERSAVVDTGGVANVIVRAESDDGLVGWGECASAASTGSIVEAARAMAPFVLGRSPWDGDAVAREVLVSGRWRYQGPTAAFALAGIDMALLDLCGRASGEPLHRLLGGAVREQVRYFCYLQWDDDDELTAQCREGLDAGRDVFYLKVGEDEALDEHRLGVVRDAIGPDARIRVDANQAWTPAQARRLIRRWHEAFDLDMVEGPVPHHPPEVMRELKGAVPVPLCADEGLRGEEQAFAIVDARCADLLCLSPYDVGGLRRMQTIAWYAERLGQRVVKHTWGETGICAAACQHLLLVLPNAHDGHQQTAQMMADDVLIGAIPIASRAEWGTIDGPGLGVEVDEGKVARFHADYCELGEYPRVRTRAPAGPGSRPA